MCLPSGARVGSKSVCWASRTNGRAEISAPPGCPLRGRDLLERRAQMDRRRARALLGAPRDRPVERPVELEHARAVAEALEPPPVAARKPLAGERDELAGRDVEQRRVRRAPSSASDSTCRPVSISPPSDRGRRRARRRSAATRRGQAASRPSARAVRARARRRRGGSRDSGSSECAASPAKRPRARSPRNDEPREDARRQCRPRREAGQRARVPRGSRSGAEQLGDQRIARATAAPCSREYRAASAPSAARGRRRASARAARQCRRRTDGRAAAGEWIHSTPCSLERQRARGTARRRPADGSPSRRRA